MPTTERPLILIADDDPDILELIVACLQPIYCTVLRARDGLAALDLARAELPVAALLDIRMPHMDGIEVTQRLKADPSTSSIAVLALTAGVDGNQPQEALQAGADRCLPKPFSPIALREAVVELLAKARMPALEG